MHYCPVIARSMHADLHRTKSCVRGDTEVDWPYPQLIYTMMAICIMHQGVCWSDVTEPYSPKTNELMQRMAHCVASQLPPDPPTSACNQSRSNEHYNTVRQYDMALLLSAQTICLTKIQFTDTTCLRDTICLHPNTQHVCRMRQVAMPAAQAARNNMLANNLQGTNTMKDRCCRPTLLVRGDQHKTHCNTRNAPCAAEV
jgi:hypothetical protein